MGGLETLLATLMFGFPLCHKKHIQRELLLIFQITARFGYSLQDRNAQSIIILWFVFLRAHGFGGVFLYGRTPRILIILFAIASQVSFDSGRDGFVAFTLNFGKAARFDVGNHCGICSF